MTKGLCEAVERVHQLLPALVQAFAGGPGVDETTVHTLQSAVQAVMRGEAPQWAPTAAEAPHEPVAEELLPEAVAPEEWLPEAEAVPELAEELVAEPEPLAGQPQGQAPDPEIVEIFTEEAAEVLETIATQLPLWRAAPLAGAPLEELRRAFHTLKGSGRMVGAELVGELSWSVEHLLNRVTERALEPSPAVIEAVERVQRALPALVRAYASGESVGEVAVRTLKASVDAVARGEAPGWAWWCWTSTPHMNATTLSACASSSNNRAPLPCSSCWFRCASSCPPPKKRPSPVTPPR